MSGCRFSFFLSPRAPLTWAWVSRLLTDLAPEFFTDLSFPQPPDGARSLDPREPLGEPGEAVTARSHLGQDGERVCAVASAQPVNPPRNAEPERARDSPYEGLAVGAHSPCTVPSTHSAVGRTAVRPTLGVARHSPRGG